MTTSRMRFCAIRFTPLSNKRPPPGSCSSPLFHDDHSFHMDNRPRLTPLRPADDELEEIDPACEDRRIEPDRVRSGFLAPVHNRRDFISNEIIEFQYHAAPTCNAVTDLGGWVDPVRSAFIGGITLRKGNNPFPGCRVHEGRRPRDGIPVPGETHLPLRAARMYSREQERRRKEYRKKIDRLFHVVSPLRTGESRLFSFTGPDASLHR